jgi:hypothetical protein
MDLASEGANKAENISVPVVKNALAHKSRQLFYM